MQGNFNVQWILWQLEWLATSIRQAKFFCVMADEVTDVSNKEQVVVCFRSVDAQFQPHEDFIGLHAVESIRADTLVEVIKDTMLRMELCISDCRGQCYDGAANMSGQRRVQLLRYAQKSHVPFSFTAMAMPLI